MAASLQHWRKHNGFTQVDAAALLGVSQPYLSLLEGGSRPLTKALRSRMNAVRKPTHQDSTADHFRRQMSALGYPLFAHVSPARAKPSPDAFLLSVLSQPDVDSRVVEALPWLVRQAKLQSLQNRMGFLFQAAGVETSELTAAAHELERARLLEESTLCWDTMPAATREWVRANRSPLAKHWNVVTTLQPQDSHHAG